MRETLAGSSKPLWLEYDTALLDLDGVTYRGPDGIPSAAPALADARTAGMTLVFVTNNASRTPKEVADHLTRLGIDAAPEEVVTAAQVAAVLLTERIDKGERVLVVGGPALRREVEAKGFTVVDSASERPAAVIQGWHPDVGWRLLAEASYAVRAGAFYLATNRDSTLPNDRGIAPGNGALVQAVVTASGIEPESAGKPGPRMFLAAAARVGATSPLVIGDRLDTDIAGARSAGIPSLLVLTGVHTGEDAIAAKAGERPHFLGETLKALGDIHPQPTFHDGTVSVGKSTARVSEGKLIFEGLGGMDRMRAACAASWQAADQGAGNRFEGAQGFGIQLDHGRIPEATGQPG